MAGTNNGGFGTKIPLKIVKLMCLCFFNMLLANRVRKSLLLMIPRLMKSAVKIDRTFRSSSKRRTYRLYSWRKRILVVAIKCFKKHLDSKTRHGKFSGKSITNCVRKTGRKIHRTFVFLISALAQAQSPSLWLPSLRPFAKAAYSAGNNWCGSYARCCGISSI